MELGRLAYRDPHAVPHRHRRAQTFLAILTAASCLVASQGGALARESRFAKHPAKTAVAATPLAARDVVPAKDVANPIKPVGIWTSGEQDRACYHSRRKLWQDGQGWIVKRVNVCP